MEEEKNIETIKKPKEKKKKYHIVEKDEIRWSIMKKYDISAEDLDKLNPNLGGKWLNLKMGDRVRVK